jgi:stage II sporulation protein AA (anti-sigma F factor antagonist)
MNVEFYKTKGTLVSRVYGELDLVTAEDFRVTVDRELEQEEVSKLVLNLRNVSFIDSSGLGVILGRYKRMVQKGGEMTIVEAKPQIHRILELSGIMRIMRVYSSESEALV